MRPTHQNKIQLEAKAKELTERLEDEEEMNWADS